MPTKAFLHKKSLLDQFKDDYKSTGYIQSARAEHTWSNPLTRRKRTNKLNGWIKSFQGKRHVHKLARFNAMQNENLEEAMSLKGFLSNIGNKLVDKYGLDKSKVQNYLGSHTQEMQELLDNKDMSLKDKAEFVRDEIGGKDEANKSSRGIPEKTLQTVMANLVCIGKPGKAMQNYTASRRREIFDELEKRGWLEPNSITPSSKGKELAKDWVGLCQESKKSESLFNKQEMEELALSEGAGVSPYLVSIAHKILTDEYGWKASTEHEVAVWLAEHKKAFEHAYGQALRNSDDDKANVRAGIEAVLDEEEKDVMNAEIAMMGESKEPADEKLGYEKGHKNSRGEDAPWVIRSHEDNRVLASFATKKAAEKHMKRMKQYSKQESKNETTDLEEYTSCVLSDLVVSFHYGEDGAKKLVDQYSDLIRDNYVDGDSYAYETARAIAQADGNRYAQEESNKNEKKSEENETELSKLVKAYCLATGGADAVPDKVEMVDKTTINDDGDVLMEFNFENEKGASGTTYALVCGDLHTNTDNDLLYFLHDWQSGEKVTPADIEEHDWELANEWIKPSEILNEKKSEDADGDLRSRMKKVGYDLLENGDLHSWEYDFIKECLDFSEFKKLEQYLIRKGWYNSPTESKKSEGIRLELEDTLQVPEWLWKAYMLNDTTDLEEDEIEKLNDFREKYKNYHLDDKSEDPYFSSRNDFDELGGNVYDVDVYRMSDEPN